MTEFSGPFTNGLTDGGPWSAATWWRLFRSLLGPNARSADIGVVRNVLNELAVTSPGADQVTVATGQAFVQGTLYESDAANTLTATRPSGGTTGKRVVLRRDAVNGGVRATVIASADGTATLPALTQDADGNYDIPLASFTHATDGTIGSLTDEREFLGIGGGMKRSISPGTFLIPAAAGAGTSVTSGGSDGTYGSLVELEDDTGSEDIYVTHIRAYTANGRAYVGVDLQLGASSSEVSAGEYAGASPDNAQASSNLIPVEPPLYVPANSRITARTMDNSTANAWSLVLVCVKASDLEEF